MFLASWNQPCHWGTLLCCRHAGDVPVFSVVPDTLFLGSSCERKKYHGWVTWSPFASTHTTYLLTTQDPKLDMLMVNLHPWKLSFGLWYFLKGKNSICILTGFFCCAHCFSFNSFFLKIWLQPWNSNFWKNTRSNIKQHHVYKNVCPFWTWGCFPTSHVTGKIEILIIK